MVKIFNFTDSQNKKWMIDIESNGYVYFSRIVCNTISGSEVYSSFNRTFHQVLSNQYFYLQIGDEEVVVFAKKILQNKTFI